MFFLGNRRFFEARRREKPVTDPSELQLGAFQRSPRRSFVGTDAAVELQRVV